MGVARLVANFAKISIGIASFVAIFYTTIDLMSFLSDPYYPKKRAPASSTTRGTWLVVSWSLLVNMATLSLFMLQHSILALQVVKKAIQKYLPQELYRTLYIVTTTIVLQTMIRNWYEITEVTLWRVDFTSFKPLWWIYCTVHVIAWLVIYVGNICRDITELVGIKQIYYSVMNLPDPNLLKSTQLRRLNSHMRHPSFLAFLTIFWCIPAMSLDRLLLAGIFTVYMYLSWNTDQLDYSYQRGQYIRKAHELKRLQG